MRVLAAEMRKKEYSKRLIRRGLESIVENERAERLVSELVDADGVYQIARKKL